MFFVRGYLLLEKMLGELDNETGTLITHPQSTNEQNIDDNANNANYNVNYFDDETLETEKQKVLTSVLIWTECATNYTT